MIDINKLRRLAHAANEHSDDRAEILAEFYAATQSDTIIELLDRLEEARTAWKEADKACRDLTEKVIPNLRESLEAAEKTNREWLRANAPGGWIDNLRAEVIHIKEVEFPRKAQAVADGWRGKCERLEAKIAEMEWKNRSRNDAQ